MLPQRMRPRAFGIFRSGNVLEFVVIGAATLAVFLLASRYEIYEDFYEFSRAHDEWGLDEIVITLAALSIFLAIFSWGRVRELKTQITQRDRAETALKASE